MYKLIKSIYNSIRGVKKNEKLILLLFTRKKMDTGQNVKNIKNVLCKLKQ